MKVKITRPDGTVIELECTAADFQVVAAALGLMPPIQLFATPHDAGSGLQFGLPGQTTFKVGHGG